MKGKIYGFVGVIGSGKSYRANQVIEETRKEKNGCVVMGDFSEGIRRFAMVVLAGLSRPINILSNEYSDWKNTEFEVPLPYSDQKSITLSGRQILKNVGEGLKEVLGPDIWARWTENDIISTLNHISIGMTKEQGDAIKIVFGSVRFPIEAKVLFDLAAKMDREVEIIFCDYKSSVYELFPHVSEKFAQRFIEMGYKDGDNITDVVREIVEKEVS